MDLSRRISRLNPEQQKLLELKLIQQDYDIYKIPISQQYRENYHSFPLAIEQEPMWVIEKLDPNNPSYDVMGTLELEGNLNIEILERSINEVIKRHEILRTVFILGHDKPAQVILPSLTLHLKLIDLRNLSANEQAHGLKQLREDTGLYIFDLTKGPLVKVQLIKLRENKSVFLIILHHIISDLLSLRIFLKELAWYYEFFLQGSAPAFGLPALSCQYPDYACWQQRWYRESILGLETRKKQETFWLDMFKDEVPVLNLPTDYPRVPQVSYEGEHAYYILKGEQLNALKEIFFTVSTTLYVLLFSIIYVFLAKIGGQEDIVVGTLLNTRKNPALNNLIGLFVKTVPLRSYPQGHKTFKNFLKEVNFQVLKVYENQDYPYEELVSKTLSQRDPSRNPLFDVLFNFIYIDISEIEMHGLKLKPYNFKVKRTGFDLEFVCERTYNELFLRITYSTKLFKEETIKRLLSYFQKIIETVIINPEVKISRIEITPDEERKQLLYDFNNTGKNLVRDKNYARLFEEQRVKSPGKIAAVHHGEHITYSQLNEEASRITALISRIGADINTIIPLYLKRSIRMLAAIIGIFKAGAAYLPLEINYPKSRICHILENSEASIVITDTNQFETLEGMLADLPCLKETICLDYEKKLETIGGRDRDTFRETPIKTHPDNLAYLIYTSGTTGKPKGVVIHQLGMLNHLYAKINDLNITFVDIIAQTASAGFDISVWQFLAGLLPGGTIVVIDKEILLDSRRFLQALQRHRVTIVESVPSLMIALLETVSQERDNILKSLKHLKWMISTGEPLTPLLVKEWYRHYPGIKLVNAYGPTEASDDITHYIVPPTEAGVQTTVPIGKPVQNMRIYILDKYLSLCPPGVRGEICTTGIGVGKGYWKDSQKTDVVFIHNPYCSEEESNDYSLLYKTGDLGYFRPDGNIECLGRIDSQVKIRGNRIELAEIESRILTHDKIKDVTVLANKDKKGDYFICAYLVLKSSPQSIHPDSADPSLALELREFLLKELPDYMVPAYFITIEQIPLTPNGKIDRKALPKPVLKQDERYKPPRNDLEKKLVEVYESVLDKKNISINESFFTIGGDSIKAIQIISRLIREGYKVEMRDMFNYTTIMELAQVVKSSHHASPQAIITGSIPLTPIQENFFAKYKICPHHFNLSFLLHLSEPLEEELIKTIFKKIQEHHDALRMTFKKGEHGDIIQTNHGPGYPFSFQVIDLREQENAKIIFEQEINKLQASIDLENGPMMKLGLYHLDNGTQLLIVLHHLVSDSVSWRILLEDMEILYQQYKKGESFNLPLKTDSYKVWAEKLREYAKSQLFLKQKAYWMELESIVVPPIKKDFAEEDNYVKDAHSLSFSLDEQETTLLLTKANEAFNTEVNDILLTALGLSIKEVFGPDKLAIVRESHGREEIIEGINVSRTVGWFTSEYPVILDLSHDDLSLQVRECKEILHRVPNGGIDYGILKYLTANQQKPEFNFKLKPQVSVNYLGQSDRDIQQFSLAKIEEFTGTVGVEERREFELELVMMIVKKRLLMKIVYNKKQYKSETIKTLLAQYKNKLSQLILYCSAKEERMYSPSDFTYKDLSFEEIDALNILFESGFGKDTPGKKGHFQDIYTLSPMQEGMLFHSLYDTTSLAYFTQINYRIRGKFEITVIKKSLDLLFKRHDILRTAFVYQGVHRPIQVVLNNRKPDFYYEDILEIKCKDEQELYIKQFKEKDKQRLFDLFTDVLMRVTVIRLNDMEYDFTWSLHHILMDGWCIGVIIEEFLEIYTSYLENREPQLSPVKSYCAYIQWLEKQDRKVSENYWAGYLHDYEDAAYIGVMKSWKTREQEYKTGQVNFSMNGEETRGLQELASRNHVTLNTLIQVVWGIILGRYNCKEDVVFGAVVSGRPSELEGVEAMIGLFINTIPVRIRFEKEIKFNELLHRVQEEALDSEPHHIYPLADIQSQSALKQNLLDNILVFENYPIAERVSGLITANDKNRKKEKFEVSDVIVFEQTNYDFNVLITPGQQLKITFGYNGNVYNSDIVESIAAGFRYLIRQILSNEGAKIKEFEILSQQERQQVLFDFNDTETQYPRHKTIPQLFAYHAGQNPDRIAMVGPKLQIELLFSITYKELNNKSNQLALLLIEKGVKPDTIVGIMVGQSIEMIIGILAILKAGGAYLPLDPEYPPERIDYLLSDSNAQVLVSTAILAKEVEKLRSLGDQSGHETIFIDSLDCSNIKSSHVLIFSTSPSSLAYIIYTSGTTGKPKGVMIQHQNAVNVVCWFGRSYLMQNTTHVPMMSAYTFDPSVNQVFGTLLHGRVLFIVHKELIMNHEALRQYIDRHQIHMIYFVPTLLNELLTDGKRLESIRVVVSGGERLDDTVKNNIINKGYALYNQYGPTETTIDALVEKCSKEKVTLGKPIANTRCYIVDKYIHLMPVGLAGELYVSGDGVSRGYLNQPELTAEQFILATKTQRHKEVYLSWYPDALVAKLYKTGDLAQWLPDGNIEFLGRIDHQAKIRGFRVELGEIESQLLKYQNIKEAVVIDKETRENKYLCAYITSADAAGISIENLRKFLSQFLPNYMIPAYFIPVEKIPLTPNGKVDRKALPDPEISIGKGYIAPRTKLEEKLGEIWSDVLGLEKEKISTDANFFELGGHSLRATILVSQIHRELDVKVPLAVVFKIPFIKGLSQYIDQARQERHTVIEAAEEKEYYVLSSAQKRLYILQQMDPGGIAYNIPDAVSLEEVPDLEKLEETFKKLVERHEILRTSIHMVNGQPVQTIHDIPGFKIEYYDLATKDIEEGRVEGWKGKRIEEKEEPFDSKNQELRANSNIKNFIHPFDLTLAPLLRVSLVKTGEGNHLLLVDMHHIISDAISHEILQREFIALYRDEELPLPRLQYKDFAQWQQSREEKKRIKHQESYWLKEFAGEIPVLDLPTDYPRPLVRDFTGNLLPFEISPGLSAALNAMASSQGISLYMLLLSAFYVFLFKLSGQEDIILGSPVAARPHADLYEIIGMFVNTLALRNFPEKEKTFKTFLREVKDRTLAAFENQEYPFEELVEKVEVPRDVSRSPLFDVMFAFHTREDTPGPLLLDNHNRQERQPLREDNSRSLRVQFQVSKFDLTIIGVEQGKRLFFTAEYSKKLFTEESIRRFIGCFRKVLSAVSRDIHQSLWQIKIISEKEKHRVLYDFNSPEPGYPTGKIIHRLFAEQAKRTPDLTALLGVHETHEKHKKDYNMSYMSYMSHISYKELNKKASQLACLLIEKGVRSDTIVGIMVERSLETIIGILAILKAGGAYLPIDPEDPKDRIDYILADSNAKVLVTISILVKEVKKLRSLEVKKNFEIIFIDSVEFSRFSSSHLLNFSTSPSSLAYILYTSGTTGKPKGVMIQHQNICNTIYWFNRTYNPEPGCHVLQMTDFVFDVSVEEIFSTLLSGAALFIPRKDTIIDREQFISYIKKHVINIAQFVPISLKELIANSDNEKIPCLDIIICGGDRLSNTLKKAVISKGYTLSNHYGPTEITVDALACKCGETNVVIGKPISNVQVFIVDKNLNLQPIGITGELCISGAGVARGYLNNPELTAQKFILTTKLQSHKEFYFSWCPAALTAKLYRTGDLARWLTDGNIEFLGRIDAQIKSRGYRIEPGEIENHLLEHKEIKEAIIVARDGGDEDKYLCAYVVVPNAMAFANDVSLSSSLRRYLMKTLPAHMTPAYFIRIDKLPLTPNGKVDLKCLPLPGRVAGSEYAAPRHETEKKLATIWAEVLNRDPLQASPIGIDDNFFELGGHSLKATAMVSMIRKELQVIVPLVEVFKNPTIRSLSTYIQHAALENLTRNDDRLILLKPGISSDKHLFFIHDGSGQVEGYIELCEGLTPPFNYWGIRSNLMECLAPRQCTIKELARDYIEKIKKVQAHGPYHIAGWSLGGTIAFEIARKLENAGERVSFLGLIDSPGPPAEKTKETRDFNIESELAWLWEYLPGNRIKEKLKKTKNINETWTMIVNYFEENHLKIEMVRQLVDKDLARIIPHYDQLGLRELVGHFNANRTLTRARSCYIPPGKVKTTLHFFTTSESSGIFQDSWNDYCNEPIKSYELPGDHFSIFKPPHVASSTKIIEYAILNNSITT